MHDFTARSHPHIILMYSNIQGDPKRAFDIIGVILQSQRIDIFLLSLTYCALH